MRSKAVVLAVFCLLVFAGGARAVTLQQGWYAQIRGVDVLTYSGPYGSPQVSGGASFDIQPGTYGPFQVTKDPYGNNMCRRVQIPVTSHGVPVGTYVELPLSTGWNSIAYLSVWWQSDYDASRMRLQLIQRDQQTGNVALLWDQASSGPQWQTTYMAFDTVGYGLAFRVLAVPEPHGALVLLMSGWTLAGVALAGRHRR